MSICIQKRIELSVPGGPYYIYAGKWFCSTLFVPKICFSDDIFVKKYFYYISTNHNRR